MHQHFGPIHRYPAFQGPYFISAPTRFVLHEALERARLRDGVWSITAEGLPCSLITGDNATQRYFALCLGTLLETSEDTPPDQRLSVVYRQVLAHCFAVQNVLWRFVIRPVFDVKQHRRTQAQDIMPEG